MNILLADKLSPRCVEDLKGAGHSVVAEPNLSGEALVEALRRIEPQVLVVRSTRVEKDALTASPSLELIVRAGAGYDTIDVHAASQQGIFVANCPGVNSPAVAELAMGLILALDRSIPDNVIQAREGRWNKEGFSRARGVKGCSLGLVGFGSIGREVARRARAFDLDVFAWSRSLDERTARAYEVTRMPGPLDIASVADIVSLHIAGTPETRGLIGRAFFERMRHGAFLINTSRASVVDEEALAWALEKKNIRAALDVFEGEPSDKTGTFSHPLAGHPNVYLTHHIGASTQQAQDAIAAEAVRVIQVYHESGRVPNCVNLALQTPATYLLTVRHLDKVGVLAAVLDEMRTAGWNVQEMENLIFSGALAACARIRFDGHPRDETLSNIAAHPDVLAASILPL